MKITSLADALKGQPMDPSHFSGPATSHPLHESVQPHPVRVSVVHFRPGIRNHWHRHSGGQLLHVLDGAGFVQVRGDQVRRLEVGDTVSAPPDEEHWHGAGPEASMSHIAVSIGDTIWLEPAEMPPPDELGNS